MIMNRTMESLLDRRSVRSFRSEQISEEELSDILVAARFAPSSRGSQLRHMTVIQNKKLLADIADATVKIRQSDPAFKPEPDYSPFHHAPTVIVFSAPKDSKWAHEDTAAAIMNTMLAAHSFNIGTCWIGSASGLFDPGIASRLGLPENYVPISALAVGYAAEKAAEPADRREGDINYIR